MDKKIQELSECKKQRRIRRKWSPTSPKDLQDTEQVASDAIPPTDFSTTPLADLLALAPEQPFRPYLDPSTIVPDLQQYGVSPSGLDFQYPEEPILPSSLLANTSNIAIDAFNFMGIREFDQRSSSSTYLSTTSLSRRLSKYSPSFIKALAHVIKAHSISGSSAATIERSAYAISINTKDDSTIGASTIRPSSSLAAFGEPRSSRLVLPSSILVLDRYIQRQGLCIPGFKSHDLKTCWCLDDLDLKRQAWVCQTGLINHEVSDPPKALAGLDLEFRDVFGNTVLHMLSARGATLNLILEALEAGVDGNAKNSAGQSFLHVLPRRAMRHLLSSRSMLQYFLQRLNSFNINFLDRDIFGRNFFHRLTRQAKKSNSTSLEMRGALRYLNARLLEVRDAFGWVDTLYTEPLPLVQTGGHTEAPGDVDWEDTNSHAYHYHARLLETATNAIESPGIEDSQGRNGLRCLAEANLNMDGAHAPGYNKRKRGQSSAPCSHWLMLRYELVQKMIASGVDVNSYDKDGATVLMAFVTHLPDSEDDKILARLFQHLIQNGANAKWRNRGGETALHIAVRLGRKVATRVLLECGANVHARTSEGKGVLALGETHYFRAREEPRLYSSIMACMALCIQYGAVATPTLIHEWSDPLAGFKFPWFDDNVI